MFICKVAPRSLSAFIFTTLLFIVFAIAPGKVSCEPLGDDDSRPVDVTSGTVAGRVIDTLGFGIPGTQITLEWNRDGHPERERGKTDSDGRFSFYYVPAGRRVYVETYARGKRLVTETREMPSSTGIYFGDIVKRTYKAAVEGRVGFGDNIPKAKAVARLYKADLDVGVSNRKPVEVKDIDGKFRFVCVETRNAYYCEVVAEGCAPAYSGIFCPRPESIVSLGILTLSQGATIKGCVKDADGRPVSGVGVSYERFFFQDRLPHASRWLNKEVPAATVSDESGCFEIDGVSSGAVVLKGQSADYRSGFAKVVIVGQDDVIEDVEVNVLKLTDFLVTVVDESGGPIERAYITLFRPFKTDLRLPHEPCFLADASGRFRFEGLFAGEYEISVSRESFRKIASRKINTSNRKEFSFTLEKLPPGITARGKLRFRIVDETTGADIEKCSVEIYLKGPAERKNMRPPLDTVRYDYTGGVSEIEWLIGEYGIYVRAKDRIPYRFTPVLIEPDSVNDLGSIILRSGSTVAGVVVDDATGDPVPGVHVGVSGESRGGYCSTDAKGRFALKGLLGGTYTLATRLKGYASSIIKDITIGAGERLVDLEVRLGSGGILEGSVIDNSGEPVPQMPLRLQGEYFATEATTDSDGNFRIENVAPGDYRVACILLCCLRTRSSSRGCYHCHIPDTTRVKRIVVEKGKVSRCVVPSPARCKLSGKVYVNGKLATGGWLAFDFAEHRWRSEPPPTYFETCGISADGSYEVWLEPENFRVAFTTDDASETMYYLAGADYSIVEVPRDDKAEIDIYLTVPLKRYQDMNRTVDNEKEN